MIRKLYTIVQSLKMQNNKCWSVLYKINKIIINLIYPITAKFNKRIGIDKDSKVIVSLTTHPTRIKTVWITIASLLSQTYKPAKVLLYLSNEQFSSGFNDLPKNLLRLQKRGLDIVLVDDDLKPHKKYFYSFKDYKDKLVITTDDDIFYPENMIEELVRASEKYPDAVICSRSHRIQLVDSDGNKQFAPYSTWNNNTTQEPEMLTLAVGCNGILYRPGLFDDELFNICFNFKCYYYSSSSSRRTSNDDYFSTFIQYEKNA
mgnify:CR=1 FL=1